MSNNVEELDNPSEIVVAAVNLKNAKFQEEEGAKAAVVVLERLYTLTDLAGEALITLKSVTDNLNTPRDDAELQRLKEIVESYIQKYKSKI